MARNGHIPRSQLTRVASSTRNYLADDAAAGMNSLYIYVRRKTRLGVISANGRMSDYRTYAQQRLLRDEWCARGACGNAAWPGTSNHGWGLARDGNSVLQAIYRANRSLMAAAGWGKTEAWNERWHFNHVERFGRPNPGIDHRNPVLRQGSGGKLQAPFVREWQELLHRSGYRLKGDGDFGPTTRRATRYFQRRSRLKTDAIVGPDTWDHARDSKVRREHRRMNRERPRP